MDCTSSEDDDLKDLNPFISDLVDFSRAALDSNYSAKKRFNLEFLKLFNEKVIESGNSSEMSFDLGMQYYELIKSETDVKISASALVAAPIPYRDCLLYTSPSPRDVEESRMPSSA